MKSKQNNRLLVGYLSFINEDNSKRRQSVFDSTFPTLENLRSQPCDILSVDNNSLNEVTNKIKESGLFRYYLHFDKNYYDTAVIYCSAKLAQDKGYPYVMYMYDDFHVYDNDFVKDCLDFMDMNTNIHCLRVPSYDYCASEKFDPTYTPKSVNPDSVRHYNTVTNEKLKWSDPIHVGSKTFYYNNWHYTSRPTIWRTDTLMTLFNGVNEIPILNMFERHATHTLTRLPLVTGVLDKGVMHTVMQSERIRLVEKDRIDLKIRVNKIEIRHEYEQKIRDIQGNTE